MFENENQNATSKFWFSWFNETNHWNVVEIMFDFLRVFFVSMTFRWFEKFQFRLIEKNFNKKFLQFSSITQNEKIVIKFSIELSITSLQKICRKRKNLKIFLNRRAHTMIKHIFKKMMRLKFQTKWIAIVRYFLKFSKLYIKHSYWNVFRLFLND